MALTGLSRNASAEPYLAVQQGLTCGQCHVNPTGGGLRNAVGHAFAQGVLPAHHIDVGSTVWTGALNNYIAIGGDFRAAATWTNPSDAGSSLDTEQARIYLGVTVIPDRVVLYLDEQVAPDAAVNREAWAQYRFGADQWYVRAGRMTLPYGLRLQDQQAFVRQVAGINMDTPDNAMELGYRAGFWDAQFAVSNGAAGGAESNDGKQYTGQVVHVRASWRIGVGGNHNDSTGQRSSSGSLFAGLRTGPMTWLAETDLVNVQPAAQPEQRLAAALLEADWLVVRGGNLKLTAEWLDPDRGHGGDTHTRFSAVAEYTPIQYLQLRLGARFLDDSSAQDQSINQAFLELHAYF